VSLILFYAKFAVLLHHVVYTQPSLANGDGVTTGWAKKVSLLIVAITLSTVSQFS